MKLDHDLTTRRLKVGDVGNVLLRQRADDLQTPRLLPLLFCQVTQDGGKGRTVSFELFLLSESILAHPPWIGIQKKHGGESTREWGLLQYGSRMLLPELLRFRLGRSIAS